MSMTATALTSEQRTEIALKESHGSVRVLAVGVADYPTSSGFGTLRQCASDAAHVIAAFTEVKQLNGHKDHLRLMNAETTSRFPMRGLILSQLRELASSAKPDERILFYFSGHGHRITGDADHYLVPGDAYDAEDPTALLSMREIVRVLDSSEAKQKIIILDACLSGPALLGKKLLAAKYSDKFFAEYLKTTRGFAVLSSSAADESSYTKSDNPKLSLFTFFLGKALRGEPSALDDQILTIPKLFDYVSTEVKRKAKSYQLAQTPGLEHSVNGTMVLGDFRRTLTTTSLDLKEHPLRGIVFRESYGENTKAILTEWTDRRKTPDQLQWAANTDTAMEAYLEEDFGKWRPKLRKAFGFGVGEIGTGGSSITFPGGSLSYEFEAESKDHGRVKRTLSMDVDWFSDASRLLSLLGIFQFDPESLELELRETLKAMEQIHSLEAAKWEVERESEDEVVASKDGVTMTVSSRGLLFEGFDIKELLATNAKLNEQQSLLAETVAAIAPPRN